MNLYWMVLSKSSSARILIQMSALIVLLTGCSSHPSQGDGEHEIQNRIKQDSEGRLRLTKFSKTNGARAEFMGLQIYIIEFDAEIEFIKDSKWLSEGQRPTLFAAAVPAQNTAAAAQLLEAVTNPGTLVKKGQRAYLSGNLRFVRKERGWSVENLEFTQWRLGD